MTDLRQLECFLAVAEHLHFGRAAQALHLGQPTVSESIRRLERELGGALFERTSRRVSLTPLGKTFLDDARAAVDAVDRAYASARALAREQALELVVGYSGELGPELVAAVAQLQRRAPGALVTLRPLSTPRQIEQLRARRLHAGICWSPDTRGDDRLATASLGTARFLAVVPVGHPLAERDEVSLAELAAEPLITWPRAANPALYEGFSAAMDATGVPWTLVGTAPGAPNVAARVLSGFGVGVIVESFVEAAPSDVAFVPLAGDGCAAERVLVWRRDAASAPLTELVDLLRTAVHPM